MSYIAAVRPVLAVVTCLSICPAACQAQERRPDPVGAVTAGRLPVGATVRVVSVRGRVHIGRIAETLDGALRLEDGAGSITTLPLPVIRAVAVRRRAWRAGLRIGLIAGGATGAALGFLLGQSRCVGGVRCSSATVGTTLSTGLLLGAGVGVVGGLLGAAFSEWHPLPVSDPRRPGSR